MTMIDRINSRLKELGLNENQLAIRMGLKGNGSVWSLLSGRTKTFRNMPALAEALETTSEWLLTGDKTRKFAEGASPRFAASEHALPPQSIDGPFEPPIYGSAAASDGRIVGLGSDHASGRLDMRALSNAYATKVAGNSMAPRYLHGDYVLVIRSEFPRPHQDCLIQTIDGEGLIKIYIEHDAKKLTYSQLNPQKQCEMAMDKVRSIELIRGSWK